MARRLIALLEERLPDNQAGFRPVQGCRDNVRTHSTSREVCCRGTSSPTPVCFIAGLDRIFGLYDRVNPGMTVGMGAHTVRMAKFEYADDTARIAEDAEQSTARVTSLAAGSISDAAIIISPKKIKLMHSHKKTRTIATTEADVAKLNLSCNCESYARGFVKLRGLKIHMTRWCDGVCTLLSRVGFLTDKTVKSSKRRSAEEASFDMVVSGSDPPLENVPPFPIPG